MAEKYPKPANADPTLVDALQNTIAALRQQLAADVERAEESTEKWRQYEREYVLPLFQRAEERGWSLQDAVRNNAGKNCVILYAEHVETTAEDLRRQLAAMTERAETTEAVVKKLPKTADGVRVSLGDEVWYPLDFYSDKTPAATSCAVVMSDEGCSKWAVQAWLPGRNKAFTTMKMLAVSDCYSTREAAEAARAGKGKG